MGDGQLLRLLELLAVRGGGLQLALERAEALLDFGVDAGLVGLRRLGEACLQLVEALRQRVPLGEDAVQLRLELLDPGLRRGGDRRLGLGGVLRLGFGLGRGFELVLPQLGRGLRLGRRDLGERLGRQLDGELGLRDGRGGLGSGFGSRCGSFGRGRAGQAKARAERRRRRRLRRCSHGRRGRGRQRRLRRGGLGADRRARGHLTQAGARAVLGAEQAAVLLGEGVGDRAGGDEAEIDEHLPERRAAAILLGEGVQKLVFRQEALVDHDLAQLSPGVRCRIHHDLYRPKAGNPEGLTHARPPASRERTRASGRRSRPSGSRARARPRAPLRATAPVGARSRRAPRSRR